MATKVTDPALLAQLEGDAPERVTDPALLAQLNGDHPAQEGGGYLKTIDNVVRSLANGATFGLADRFAAGMSALTGVGGQPAKLSDLVTGTSSNDYAGNLAREQRRTDEFAQAHPVGNFAANAVGGLGVPLGVLGAASKGATLGTKTLMGLGTGAGLGAVGGAASSRDWTDLPQVGKDTLVGLGTGAALGAALPVAGAGIGAGFNWLSNVLQSNPGIPRAAVPHLVEALKADGIPGVQRELDRLGPNATLADTGPALQGKLQGATLNSDEARSIAQGTLTQRNQGTNARIMSDVNAALGPAEDPQTVTNAIRAQRSAVDNAAYPAALDKAAPVDTAPILRQLDSMIPKSVGMEKKALENMRGMLTRTEENAPAVAQGAPPPESPPVNAQAEHAATVEEIRQKYGDGAAAAYDRQNRVAPVASAPANAPKAQSLTEFLASKGGLGPDAELEAIGGNTHTVNVEGVGRRKLVRQGGWPLDYAREAAEEAGYLQGNHNGTSTVNDLLDAIDAEMRGQKRYPAGQEGYQTKREAAAMSEREQHEYDRHISGLESDLAAAGHDQLGPDVRKRAVDLMAREGMAPDTAVEHALRQMELEDNVAHAAFPGDRAKTSAPVLPPQAKNKQVPQTDASVLHKVKQELDNVIQYDAPGLGVPAGALSRQQGTLKLFRGQLNAALEKQVPGYAEANRQSAALAKRADAVEAGTQYLGAGKTTASPERFEAEFNPLAQGEKIAFAKGSRGNIERLLGTKANDLQALRSELQGEGGWNTAKLGTVHGQEAADQLISSVERNLKFRDTYNKVVEGSQTAQRTAAAKAMKPDASTETPLINPNMTLSGLVSTVGKKGAAAIFNAILKKDPTAAYGDVARILSAQGPQAQAHLDALARILSRRNANKALSGNVGNLGALLLGAAANSARGQLTAPSSNR